MPVLGVCRGFQEINVALGGTLHQAVHDVPGLNDHRENDADPLEAQYGPSHPVALTARRPAAPAGRRGPRRRSIRCTARASTAWPRAWPSRRWRRTAWSRPIAAKRPGFLLAVQWHPEWRFRANPVSRRHLPQRSATPRRRRDSGQRATRREAGTGGGREGTRPWTPSTNPASPAAPARSRSSDTGGSGSLRGRRERHRPRQMGAGRPYRRRHAQGHRPAALGIRARCLGLRRRRRGPGHRHRRPGRHLHAGGRHACCRSPGSPGRRSRCC